MWIWNISRRVWFSKLGFGSQNKIKKFCTFLNFHLRYKIRFEIVLYIFKFLACTVKSVLKISSRLSRPVCSVKYLLKNVVCTIKYFWLQHIFKSPVCTMKYIYSSNLPSYSMSKLYMYTARGRNERQILRGVSSRIMYLTNQRPLQFQLLWQKLTTNLSAFLSFCILYCTTSFIEVQQSVVRSVKPPRRLVGSVRRGG